MGWSPPKKITVVISLFLLVFGLLLGVVGTGIMELPQLVLLFLAWFLVILGVTMRGI